jgi:hypothetical protein
MVEASVWWLQVVEWSRSLEKCVEDGARPTRSDMDSVDSLRLLPVDAFRQPQRPPWGIAFPTGP